MTDFRYGKAIKDSFSLLFRNLNIFAPYGILLFISLLITPLLMRFNTQDGFMSILEGGSISKLALTIMSISGLYILLIVISLFVYGWTFDLIGQAVKKGKIDLMEGLKNSPGKSLNLFVIYLLLFLFFIAFFIVIMLFVMLFALILIFSKPIGVILIIILVLAALVAILIISVSMMNIVSILSLEKAGPIETIKKSFLFYKKNKGYAWAIFGIELLFSLIAAIISVILYLIVIFSMYGASFFTDYASNPQAYYSFSYLLLTTLAFIPSYITMWWMMVFITLSYARKTEEETKIESKTEIPKKASKKVRRKTS